MQERTIVLAIVLAAFSALTGYAVYEHGIVGIFESALANSATMTLTADLLIALSLVMTWMWQDAKARGTSAVPYIILTLGFGSVGPLLYLLRRETSGAQSSHRIAPHAARVS